MVSCRFSLKPIRWKWAQSRQSASASMSSDHTGENRDSQGKSKPTSARDVGHGRKQKQLLHLYSHIVPYSHFRNRLIGGITEVSTIYKGQICQAYVWDYPNKIWPKIWHGSSILGSWRSPIEYSPQKKSRVLVATLNYDYYDYHAPETDR